MRVNVVNSIVLDEIIDDIERRMPDKWIWSLERTQNTTYIARIGRFRAIEYYEREDVDPRWALAFALSDAVKGNWNDAYTGTTTMRRGSGTNAGQLANRGPGRRRKDDNAGVDRESAPKHPNTVSSV
jgi:hypothetical protein